MATIKAVKKKTTSKGGLKKTIDYIENPQKTDDKKLIEGYNCTTENAYNEFVIIKELRENEKGVMAHHFTQNFDPKDNITPQKALELGKELAEKNFKGHQVIIATHIDKQHIHNHLIVNSVNYETGKKLINNNKLLEQLKSYSDKQCERENLHIVDREKKSKDFDYGIYDKNKYEVIMQSIKGQRKSYILDTARAVEKNIKISQSKENFIKNMEKEGYKVKWSDTRKNITYEDKEGHKVRADNLAKTFKEDSFKKEEMLKQFEKNKEKINENTKENKIQELKNERKILNEKYQEINKKYNMCNEYKKNSDLIKEYKNKIESEKQYKKNLGLFKSSEKKNIDDRISKLNTAISKIENNISFIKNQLFPSGGSTPMTKTEMLEEMQKIEMQRINIENQLKQNENEIRQEQERAVKEQLEKDKIQKELLEEEQKKNKYSEVREREREGRPKEDLPEEQKQLIEQARKTYINVKIEMIKDPNNKELQKIAEGLKNILDKYKEPTKAINKAHTQNKNIGIER